MLAYFRGDPHFLQLIAYCEKDMALCTKYYPVGSLADWIESNQKGVVGPVYDAKVLLGFASDIATGLDKMHAAGFVHSDVKPGNILVDSHLSPLNGRCEYTAVISDLGSMKVVDNQSMRVKAFKVIRKNEATIAYAAPEVVARFFQPNGEPLTQRADWTMSTQEAKSTDVFGYGMVYTFLLCDCFRVSFSGHVDSARAADGAAAVCAAGRHVG